LRSRGLDLFRVLALQKQHEVPHPACNQFPFIAQQLFIKTTGALDEVPVLLLVARVNFQRGKFGPPALDFRIGYIAGKFLDQQIARNPFFFDGDVDVTESGRGQPACRGPATSLGYLGGTDHDKLFTKDGWMRMGDICELDADGYLSLAGRTSDFILRGGKNISAVQVEEAVATHPAVAVAAAVAMPDPLFGERVCVFVELKGADALDLPTLVDHLLAQGVSKELLPERLEVLDELPRSVGGKIAKGRLRDDIRLTLERS